MAEFEALRAVSLAKQEEGFARPHGTRYISEMGEAAPVLTQIDGSDGDEEFRYAVGERFSEASGEAAQVVLRRNLRQLYARTQAYLQKYPGETVRRYRGVKLDVTGRQANRIVQVADVASNAVESWTLDLATAVKCSGRALKGAAERAGQGVVLTPDVPKKRLLALPDTGQGSLYEYEALVLGAVDLPDKALIVHVDQPKHSTGRHGLV